MTDWTPPEPKHWPTRQEVREIISTILKHIDSSPDWWKTPSQKQSSQATDETWKGWGRK